MARLKFWSNCCCHDGMVEGQEQRIQLPKVPEYPHYTAKNCIRYRNLPTITTVYQGSIKLVQRLTRLASLFKMLKFDFKWLLFVITFQWIVISLTECTQANLQLNRSFVIDYVHNQFLLDGEPFRYVAGEMHYFRVPQQYWSDRFLKMKAGGLNAVQTYIEWSQHEPQPGVYNFGGMLDIEAFFQTADLSGLLVIIRAGPYICGGRDMGGLPSWLLQKHPDMTLRSSDPNYLQYVDSWLGVLLPKIRPYLYENGGPVISLQVENEYGSYYACDFGYMTHLRDRFRELLGETVVLFTTDGNDDSYLKCGKTQDLHATIDFGPGANVSASFEALRNHEPRGPLVNSEYYPGFDVSFWGYARTYTPLNQTADTLDQILALNASVSMFMYTGGTSFGFTNGALDNPYTIYMTSNDYNSPISEAGDTVDSFFVIRDVISKYLPVPSDPIPANTSKYAYGTVPMTLVGSFFEILPLIANLPPVFSLRPQSFEALGQAYGFVLYETVITVQYMQPQYLSVPKISDRGYVFVDKVFTGILSRVNGVTKVPIRISMNQTLSILVENQGRVIYGPTINDFKGIHGNLSVIISGQSLTNWNMTRIPFDNINVGDLFSNLISQRFNSISSTLQTADCPIVYPALFTGDFFVPNAPDQPMDTFLELPGWSKGIAFINGYNLGRYWPVVGPQITLFIPKYFINPYPQANQIVIFEQENSPCTAGTASCDVQMIDQPILIGPTPYTEIRNRKIKP